MALTKKMMNWIENIEIPKATAASIKIGCARYHTRNIHSRTHDLKNKQNSIFRCHRQQKWRVRNAPGHFWTHTTLASSWFDAKGTKVVVITVTRMRHMWWMFMGWLNVCNMHAPKCITWRPPCLPFESAATINPSALTTCVSPSLTVSLHRLVCCYACHNVMCVRVSLTTKHHQYSGLRWCVKLWSN